MLQVTQESMSTIFEIPSICAARNLRGMKISRFFGRVLKCSEIRFFNKTARFCSFYDICKSFVRQEQSQKKLKHQAFGNLGIGISASALALHFSLFLASRCFFVEKIDHLCCLLWLVSQYHDQLAKIVFPYDFSLIHP